MILKEHFFTSADKLTQVKVVGKIPLNAWASLIIAHGIGENTGRYEEMMTELTEKGIAVYAMDFIGHGASVSENKAPMYFGENGWDYLVSDLISCNKFVTRRHPNIPCYMLGFSMGSFVLRTALAEKPAAIKTDGAIFAGTGYISGITASLVRKLVAVEAKKNGGFDTVSQKVNDLAFGNYNKYFKPTKTAFDWLCKNEEAMQEYVEDTTVAKYITPGMFSDLLNGMARSNKKEAIENTKKIPILFLAGKDDPVGDFTKGVKKVCEGFKAKNFKISTRFYPNSRHDIFHDNDKKSVREDIYNWIFRITFDAKVS